MANSELYNKTFKIPSEVLNSIHATLISNPNGDGVKRAKTLLKNGIVTYQTLKRLKNFFDYFNQQSDDKAQFALAGGDLMRSFVERTLNDNRKAVSREVEMKRDVKDNNMYGLKPDGMPALNEEIDSEKLKKNSVAIIVDKDNKILLLKRADVDKIWMPNKWSLVGGGIEKGETAEKAIEREILEETELIITDSKKIFTIQRHKDSIEHVFACRYDGDPTDVKLNDENVKYGWYDLSEINYLDTVPHLMEYITLTFKKYNT